MAHIDPAQIGATVKALIAGQFGVSPDDITYETVAEDIDGWDSLAHTVLMMRIGKRLGIEVDERVAAAADVGEMIALLSEISG